MLQTKEIKWYPYSQIEQHIEIDLSVHPQVKMKSSLFLDNNLKVVDVNYCRTHNKAIGNFVTENDHLKYKFLYFKGTPSNYCFKVRIGNWNRPEAVL